MKPETPTILHIHNLLLAEYGSPPHQHDDPVAILVLTILSQNTNDTNRDRAYRQMRERFPTWETVRDADVKALVDAVRPAGLAPTKAPRIQTALRHITATQGEISLDFLADMPLEQARQWLLDLPGVGPKTAAIVLLFGLGRPAFPVDTHVHRVSKRLGLIPERTSREKAHKLLEALIPPELYYDLHLNLIAHGRAVCQASNPKCTRCILQGNCAYAATHPSLRLILIRHAQTVANVEGRWIGRGDTGLTPLGKEQVKAVARRLAEEVRGETVIYTSPLARALRTAAGIGAALGVDPVPVEELREVNFGDMEGIRLEEMREQHPALFARWRDKEDSEFTWPGGDRRADFFHRVAGACDRILARHHHGTVVIVAHGGTIRACLAHLLPGQLGRWWDYALDNCGLTELTIGKSVRLVTLNDAAHLEKLGPTGSVAS